MMSGIERLILNRAAVIICRGGRLMKSTTQQTRILLHGTSIMSRKNAFLDLEYL